LFCFDLAWVLKCDGIFFGVWDYTVGLVLLREWCNVLGVCACFLFILFGDVMLDIVGKDILYGMDIFVESGIMS
jgi:hypothetical protein